LPNRQKQRTGFETDNGGTAFAARTALHAQSGQRQEFARNHHLVAGCLIRRLSNALSEAGVNFANLLLSTNGT
jgi:hypothetical protein